MAHDDRYDRLADLRHAFEAAKAKVTQYKNELKYLENLRLQRSMNRQNVTPVNIAIVQVQARIAQYTEQVQAIRREIIRLYHDLGYNTRQIGAGRRRR